MNQIAKFYSLFAANSRKGLVIIPMKDLKKAFTCTAIVLLCCAMISLSGCGVFLLGDPSGDKAPEDTGVQ